MRFITNYSIYDGEKEYHTLRIIEAKDIGEAEQLAEKLRRVLNYGDGFYKDGYPYYKLGFITTFEANNFSIYTKEEIEKEYTDIQERAKKEGIDLEEELLGVNMGYRNWLELIINFVKENKTENRELAEKYVRDHYLNPDREGCVHEDWIGDDILLDISNMFYSFYRPIANELERESGTKESIFIHIEPSYEDTTITLAYQSSMILYKDACKPWHFYFENEKELNEYAEQVYKEMKGNLEKRNKILDAGFKV